MRAALARRRVEALTPPLEEIAFTVYGTPQPGGSKRGFARGRHVTIVEANPRAKDWKSSVAQVSGEIMAGRDLLAGPLCCEFAFYRRRPKGHFRTNGELNAKGRRTPYPDVKPDLTKLVRSTEDALSGVVWRDDNQVVSATYAKHYGSPERVEIKLRALGRIV